MKCTNFNEESDVIWVELKKNAHTFLAFDIDNPKIDNIEARE